MRGMILLTDTCLAYRQALLGHGDTVYIFANEDNLHHSEDILQQILSFLFSGKGRISFSAKIKGLLPNELRVLKNQSDR